jgi:twitching motility protein PilJ
MASILSKLKLPGARRAAPGKETAARVVDELKRAGDRPVPLIGRLPFVRQVKLLSFAMAGFLLLAGAAAFVNNRFSAHDTMYLEVTGQMRTLTQRLAKAALQAAQTNAAAFGQLQESRDAFNSSLDLLARGGERGGTSLPASPDEIQPLLAELAKQWEASRRHAANILAEKDVLVATGKAFGQINAGNDALLDQSEQLVALMSQAGSGVREFNAANQLVMLTQRIAKNANLLQAGQIVDPEAAFLLGKDANSFADIVRGLTDGSEALRLAAQRNADVKEQLDALRESYGDYQKNVVTLLQRLQNLVAAKTSSVALFNDSETLLGYTDKLLAAYQAQSSSSFLLELATAILLVAALVCLVLLGKVTLDDARRRARESEQANQRTQQAILRLLDEMGNLAQGDLTVHAQVTESVTGAIADSINFAVEEMRRLVAGILRATDQVTTATGGAQQITGQLLTAARRQAEEIQETSSAVGQMAQSIGQVSERAAESAQVAGQSLAAASQGAQAVHDAIAGMNSIREQIQDTAKRIKRLGESSQEIGEIVDLISDITEQTNVLALNAAIQATSAGAAGRGFTVVAEEVQRLAERSAEATKQIGAIVKTIQSDTQDAIGAMERSTQGVVDQTRLADAAGQALAKIEDVSRRLAALIEAISLATREQSAAAARVTGSMKDILGITDLTTDGTRRTADSTAQLAGLAQELRQSVAGFKVS